MVSEFFSADGGAGIAAGSISSSIPLPPWLPRCIKFHFTALQIRIFPEPQTQLADFLYLRRSLAPRTPGGNAMTDPRFTDPRYNDPRTDPVLRRDESVGGMWGWIAGLSVLALIAFVLIAGWNSNPNTASNGPATPPMTTGSATGTAPMRMTPPSTTGSGTMSPQPATPAPANNDRK
jgi:hypothetical protein